jgi:hypothetical protein
LIPILYHFIRVLSTKKQCYCCKKAIFYNLKKYLDFFEKALDKRGQAWYNICRYPKTAGSGKSEGFPAEERN